MKIQCDKCKEIYDNDGTTDYHEHEEGCKSFMLSEINFYGLHYMGIDNSNKYLCPKCTHELIKWIGDKK